MSTKRNIMHLYAIVIISVTSGQVIPMVRQRLFTTVPGCATGPASETVPPVPTMGTCSQHCVSHDNCNNYNWYPNTGRCELFFSKPKNFSSVVGCVHYRHTICLYIPCKNAGTCIEGATADDYTCVCANRFAGQTCTIECPSGFSYQAATNFCYNVVAVPMTWDNAGLNCRSMNNKTHLVVIDSALKNTVVVNAINALSVSDQSTCANSVPNYGGYFLGGQRIDVSTQSTFVWKPYPGSGNFTAVTYTNWYPGEPNYDHGTECCLDLSVAYGLQWNDATCSFTVCSVCEFDMF